MLSHFVRAVYGLAVLLLMMFGVLLALLHGPLAFIPLSFDIRFLMTYMKPFYVNYGYCYLSFILEYLCGIKCKAFVSPSTYHFLEEYKRCKDPGSIIISMNHRCRSDWMMIWLVLVRLELIQYLIIIARKLLRFVPFIGWVFCWVGVFLERNWSIDRSILLDMIKVLGSRMVEPRCVWLFFTEGTDLWHVAIAKSNAYADKHNLPHFKYVLHPRTKGLVQIVHELNENLYGVLDATIAYIDYAPHERFNEFYLALGRYPKAVYFYFEFVTIDDMVRHYRDKSVLDGSSAFVPLSQRQKFVRTLDGDHEGTQSEEQIEVLDNAIAQWLKQSFQRKEQRLTQWYEHGRWLEDEPHKIEYQAVPRSSYAIALAIFAVHVVAFIWVWNNMRWYVWLSFVIHTFFALHDTAGKMYRSYRPWVERMEKENKNKNKNKKMN